MLENLPAVSDRGAPFTEPLKGTLKTVPMTDPKGGCCSGRGKAVLEDTNDSPVSVGDVQVVVRETQWLLWKLRCNFCKHAYAEFHDFTCTAIASYDRFILSSYTVFY